MGKKYKECKVEYVDDVKTSFEVKCGEIRLEKEKNEYKIYGRTASTGWQLLSKKHDKQKAIDYAKNLNPEIYDGRIVIEYNKETDTDTPIDFER